ncbi:tRNA lysidine(34) synthetase TilS [Zavarzinella formosa]|uniref:tRNA lysidine(34) synthetase TilS n=1 Tax=Zavarzinella formosa TaxID=360055 RepID=UPI00030F8DD5|nr:tRNA lysidine(34) synthetase TilS [Zavarzinella formosa]
MDISHSRFSLEIHASLSSILGNERGPGVLAVSGGADSVAMRRAFRELPWAGGISIAHFNHQLREKESDADAAFVNQLAGEQFCHHGTADVRAIATATGENLEAAARRLRYDFLAQVAKENNARWVATAHTADDQAETVLHRMIRGSGIRGLRGIAPARPLVEGVQLVRPMLGLTRADVLDYLRTTGQSWREDATNQDTAYTRNRIRHELLPLLKTFNPHLSEALGRLASQAQEVYAEVDQRIGELLSIVERPKAGSLVILSQPPLAGLPDHDLRELFHRVWEREGWPLGGMTRDHWQRAAAVAHGEMTATDMPDGISIRGTGRLIRVGPR